MSTVHSQSGRRASRKRPERNAQPPASRAAARSASIEEPAQPASTAPAPAPASVPQPIAAAPAAKTSEAGSLRESWIAFARGFVYAGRGLGYALRTQRNMRVHLALACAAIVLGIALRISAVEFALVFIAIMLVFGTEMLNTVVESVVDLVTQDYHPLARIAKDVAAGAVLLNAVLAVIIALFVYVPHLWRLVVR